MCTHRDRLRCHRKPLGVSPVPPEATGRGQTSRARPPSAAAKLRSICATRSAGSASAPPSASASLAAAASPPPPAAAPAFESTPAHSRAHSPAPGADSPAPVSSPPQPPPGERRTHTTRFLWDQKLWNKVLLSEMAGHAAYLPDGLFRQRGGLRDRPAVRPGGGSDVQRFWVAKW